MHIQECAAVTTSRGDHRLLLRFSERPPEPVLHALRETGKYRRAGYGQPPAWYVSDFNALRRRLAHLGLEQWSEALRRACKPLNQTGGRPAERHPVDRGIVVSKVRRG
jgi:hypothetical protein